MSKIQIDESGYLIINDQYISSQYHQSKNKKYIVAFRIMVLGIPNILYLIENKSKILWEKEFTEDSQMEFVFDDGRVIFCSNKEYFLFNRDGQELFRYNFNSNITGSEFSEKNSLLIITTREPDNRIYCFNISENKLLWVKNNLSLSRLFVIKFLDNNIISLSNGQPEEDSYCIDFNGNLIEGRIKESATNKRSRLESAAFSKFIEKQYAEAEHLFSSAYAVKRTCLFNWEDVPGKDSKKFLNFLNFMGLDEGHKTNIEKSTDGKRITVVAEGNPFSLVLNQEENKAILTMDDSEHELYEFIVGEENGKLKIYEHFDNYEDFNLCNYMAKTKYKLGKYSDAIIFWRKYLHIDEKFYKRNKFSENEILHLNPNIKKNIGRAYRKLIKLNDKFESEIWEKEYKQFINKYPNQSIELKPRPHSKKRQQSYSIDIINNAIYSKFLKEIKIKKKSGYVIFIDEQILYLDGSQKPYNLIKTDNEFEIEWKNHYLYNIEYIWNFDENIIIHTQEWLYGNEAGNNNLEVIDDQGKEISKFNIDSYLRLGSKSSDFVVTWSNDSKIRLFNKLGDFLWDYEINVSNICDISVSDAGLILYSCKDTAYVITKDKESVFKWKCPKTNHKENVESKYVETYSNEDFKFNGEVSIGYYNDILDLKISGDSNYIFIGCYSGDLFCLNLNEQIIWNLNIGNIPINRIFVSNNNEHLLAVCQNSHMYFIANGNIVNKYESKNTGTLIDAKYHNNKDLVFVSDGKDFLIFDKNGNILNKITFNNNIKCFDISEKIDKVAISSDNIYIFSIEGNI